MSATVISMPPAPSPRASPETVEPEPRTDEQRAKPYVINKAFRQTKCRGSKKECASATNTIEKGQVRFGTRGEMDGRESVFWRHLQCVTDKMLLNKGVSPDAIRDNVDFCENDGTKMSITLSEGRIAENVLRGKLGAEPLPEIAADPEETKPEKKQPKKKRKIAESEE